MRTREELLEALHEENPDALLPDGLEGAFIGIGRRCGQPAVAICSRAKAVAILAPEMGYQEAEEWVSSQCEGAWVGPGTPIWMEGEL